MKPLSRRAFLATGLGASVTAFGHWETRPDTVLYNGRILTMGVREAEVQALALAGPRVLAIGTSAEMLALAATGTRRVDLGGKCVTPGFNDAHSHPLDGGVALLTQVALEMDSIEAIQAAIRSKAAATPPGEWVVGFLYDDTKTPRPLERADLDAAAPDHPVVVQHRGGHTAFVNSRALVAVKVDESTPDPVHGSYFRDAAGRHNGRVAENAVDAFLQLAIKPPSREDYRKGAALISKRFASRGITSACEADGNPAILQGYQDARDAGELTGRFYVHIDYGCTRPDDGRRRAHRLRRRVGPCRRGEAVCRRLDLRAHGTAFRAIRRPWRLSRHQPRFTGSALRAGPQGVSGGLAGWHARQRRRGDRHDPGRLRAAATGVAAARSAAADRALHAGDA